MKSELRECPFCGSVTPYRTKHAVRCDACEAEGPYVSEDTYDDACVDACNTRTYDARILQLEADAHHLKNHALLDPNAIHVNMLRGTIAKPSIEQIIHLYGREALLSALLQS